MCEMCLDESLHYRCMTTEEKERWEKDHVWLCRICNDKYKEATRTNDHSNPFVEEVRFIIRTARFRHELRSLIGDQRENSSS